MVKEMRGGRCFRQFNSITRLQQNPNSYPSKKTLLFQKKHNPPFPDADIKKWNVAISTHMRNAQLESALRVFNSMPRRSSVSYNAMISGLTVLEMWAESGAS
ncbi:hypothetical protein CCACVL1_24529 [Corchorus capsularis]|uniref:Pentatricopeptide repeat-containing protein n=1 Tax=Corchorus capsularis TaxID=210143 RepID=A0A1R3GPF7_COCAP|nr:hypothetical protein CCACVL1_24529 [Corchorus capsularis]